MSIRVLFFASLADVTGIREADDVGSIWRAFVSQFPSLAGYETAMLSAVNAEFAGPETPVHDGDEVAFLPPVSGG